MEGGGGGGEVGLVKGSGGKEGPEPTLTTTIPHQRQPPPPLPPPSPPPPSFPRIGDVLREDLDVWFSYPSATQEPGQPPEFYRSTRVLLYDRGAKLPQDEEGNPISEGNDTDDEKREIVIKGVVCPNAQEKERVLGIIEQLYQPCTAIDVPPNPEDRARLWSKLPCSMFPNHQGILPMLGVFSAKERLYLATEYQPYTLLALMRFNSPSLESSMLGRLPREGLADLRSRFMFFQLLNLIDFVHSRGLAVGNINPRAILISSDMLWLQTVPCLSPMALGAMRNPQPDTAEMASAPNVTSVIPRPPGYGTPLTQRWVNGHISNLEYLMEINTAAGRSMIDAAFHPVLPWVSDLTVKDGGWRDLAKSKFRLNKGDAQLDSTYLHYAHTSQQHHIPESLSEITFYIYTARRTPLKVLQTVVRADFVPQHYPSSMQRMYEWTPDECIPEFFTDPTVFSSLHKDIESEYVSRHLHHWIDLNFGFCLDGHAAVENKNVPLKVEASLLAQGLVKNPGFVQLFRDPHPQRAAATGAKARRVDHAPIPTPTREGLHLKFDRAHEGTADTSNAIHAHASDAELLKRAPNIRLDNLGISTLMTCHEGVDRLQMAHFFSKGVDKRLSPCYYPCEKSFEGTDYDPTSLYRLQKEDMFAAGCVLGELYLGTPLFSTASVVGGPHPPNYRKLLPEEMYDLPIPIRAAVQWLVHDDFTSRPTASELLRLRRGFSWRDNEESDSTSEGAPPDPRIILLRKACQSLFPDYFGDLYGYLSAVHAQQQRGAVYQEITMTLGYARQSFDLPLQAFSLVLPYMLRVLDNPVPLEEWDVAQQAESPLKKQVQLQSKLLEVIPFIDQLGKKMGSRYTQRLIFPRVVSFIEKIQTYQALERFLLSPLWSILIRRATATSFVTQFSPLLIRLLRDPRPGVPQTASQALTDNVNGFYEVLGPGLISRYVIPQLLDTIGVWKAEELSESPRPSKGMTGMHHVQTLTALCLLVDDEIIVRLAAEYLINETLPELEPSLLPEPQEYICSALLEIFLALQGLLPALSENSIVFHYCRQSSLPVPALLITIPLPPPPIVSPPSSPTSPGEECTSLEPNSLRHRTHVELCRLVGQVCVCIGAEATKEAVAPFMDKFFAYFSDTYHDLDGAEPGSKLFYTKRAALEIVDELWRNLTFMFDEVDLRRFLPNGFKLVAVWYDKEKKEGPPSKDGDRWGKLSGGGSGGNKEKSNGLREIRRPVTPSGEKDRWPDVVGHHLEKGLNWLAKRHRSHRDSGAGMPNTPHAFNEWSQPAQAVPFYQGRVVGAEDNDPDRLPTAEVVAASQQRSPGSSAYSREHMLAARWAGSGVGDDLSGSGAAVSTPPSDDWQEGMELQELADQRERMKSRDAGLETSRRAPSIPPAPSHSSSEESGRDTNPNPLGGGHVRRTQSAGPTSSLTLHQARPVGKGSSLSPPRPGGTGGGGGGLGGRDAKPAVIADHPVSDPSDEEEGAGYESDGDAPAWDGYAYAQDDNESVASTPSTVYRDTGFDIPAQKSPTASKRDVVPGKQVGLPSLAIPPPPPSTTSSARSKRESWFTVHAGSAEERRRKEQVWLLGPAVETPVLTTKTLLQSACAWPFRLCVHTSIEAYKGGSTVRSLGVDQGERLLLTGSRRGMIKIWSLSSYPVTNLSHYEQHNDCILSMSFLDGGERVVSLDAGGCLLLWDVTTKDTLARRERASEGGLAYLPYVAFDVLSGWSGVSPSLDSGSTGCQQILAATPTTLYHFDMREKQASMGGSTVVQVHKSSEWFVSSGSLLDPSEMGLHRGMGGIMCLTSHEDGNWICTGSSNGQLCVLDKRTGTIRHNWQGHDNAVIKLAAWNRHQVVSVSLDRAAVLWDLRGSPYPIRVSMLRGLPDSPPGISMSTVLMHEFRRSPSSVKKQPLLLVFAGYKGCVAAMPADGVEDRAKPRSFVTSYGSRLLKYRMSIQSAAILPLRQLLLLGCEDGLVRVCT